MINVKGERPSLQSNRWRLSFYTHLTILCKAGGKIISACLYEVCRWNVETFVRASGWRNTAVYRRFDVILFFLGSWKWRVSVCRGKYRVAMWWFYRQADRVKMDVGDGQWGYRCHFTDQEVPRPESMPLTTLTLELTNPECSPPRVHQIKHLNHSAWNHSFILNVVILFHIWVRFARDGSI